MWKNCYTGIPKNKKWKKVDCLQAKLINIIMTFQLCMINVLNGYIYDDANDQTIVAWSKEQSTVLYIPGNILCFLSLVNGRITIRKYILNKNTMKKWYKTRFNLLRKSIFYYSYHHRIITIIWLSSYKSTLLIITTIIITIIASKLIINILYN